MTKRSNKPIWLVLSLITLGVLITLLAHMIAVDSQTDEMTAQSEVQVSVE